jgi:hypothetical protein
MAVAKHRIADGWMGENLSTQGYRLSDAERSRHREPLSA